MAATVLVIDDDPDFVELIRVVLRDSYRVEGCTVSRDALRRIQQVEPSLIFLDLNMPPPSGWELLRALRADSRFADVPILVVSASGEEASAGQAPIGQVPGRLEVLAKPFEVDELARRAHELLQPHAGGLPTDELSTGPSTRVDSAS
ncbi:MAG: response regulator [Chloroflexota bacterium]